MADAYRSWEAQAREERERGKSAEAILHDLRTDTLETATVLAYQIDDVIGAYFARS